MHHDDEWIRWLGRGGGVLIWDLLCVLIEDIEQIKEWECEWEIESRYFCCCWCWMLNGEFLFCCCCFHTLNLEREREREEGEEIIVDWWELSFWLLLLLLVGWEWEWEDKIDLHWNSSYSSSPLEFGDSIRRWAIVVFIISESLPSQLFVNMNPLTRIAMIDDISLRLLFDVGRQTKVFHSHVTENTFPFRGGTKVTGGPCTAEWFHL